MKALLKRLPKVVRVGPYDFKVELMGSRREIGTGNMGEFSSAEFMIRIAGELPSIMLVLDTLLHEICHAICFAYHIRESDDEERTVSLMGTGWAQVYRDNPSLLAWIAESAGHA